MNMRIILAIFNDRFEAYTSLKPFFAKYSQYLELKEQINYTMSRKKTTMNIGTMEAITETGSDGLSNGLLIWVIVGKRLMMS